jgi:hypothetical protein
MAPVSTLETLYGEVCNAYHAITEFRGKLLALVPVVSGAGFTLIIRSPGNVDQRLLLPVGIFGLAVTLGLFVYELRGIFLCHELRNRGELLERAMQRPEAADELMRGHFLDRPKSHGIRDAWRLLDHGRPIMVPTASFLVYGTVLIGWLVVCGFGVVGFV